MNNTVNKSYNFSEWAYNIINDRGNMYACTSYSDYGGDLLKESFSSIWERYAHIKNEEITNLNECVKCDALHYCNNCPSDQKAYYNNAEKVNEFLCKFAKAKKNVL
jgi:radical SAM protein with 4Fe4S-binding SPASM domain